MSKASAESSGAARSDERKPLVRPLSPHLQVWRWHVTMLGSILHRASGIGLYVGALMVTAWVAALAAGPEAYAGFTAFGGSPIGLLLWFAFSAGAFYHLASGLRHLVWDTGLGLLPKTANLLTNLSIVFAILATVGFWAWLIASGSVVL
jgi:succinate dehydrogenase / fumarate reductase cytochrome b subunit